MRKVLLALCLVTVCYRSVYAEDISAAELITDIYKSCLSQYSTSCVKPKALSWISHAVNQDTIRINDDLTIIRTGEDEFGAEARSANPIVNLFDKVDSFLTSHSLRIEAPQILKNEEARSYIPNTFLSGGLAEGLEVPLVEGNAVEGELLKLLKLFAIFITFCIIYRSRFRQEGYDPLLVGSQVQDDSSRSPRSRLDRPQDLEGNDPRTPFPRHDTRYGHLQVRQAKDCQL